MVYVTSDLHGYDFEKFNELLKSAGFSDGDFLFVLGDVIDRGDDGITLLKWMMAQPNVQLILGNHEAMLLSCRFLFYEVTEDTLEKVGRREMQLLSNWMANGAGPTVRALRALDSETRAAVAEYIEDAPLYDTVSVGERDFLLTHSGLGGFKKGKRLSEYTADELLWNRPRMSDRYYESVTTVFGHTPTCIMGEEYSGRAVVTDTWINIDTGAAVGMSPMLLRLDDMKEFYVKK